MSTPSRALPTATDRDRTLSIFGEVMGLVAITCLFAAAGAYIGKDLTGLTVLVPWLVAIGCIFGLNVANARGNRQLALVLLFAFGLLLGIAVGNMLNVYATANPQALYQAAAATGLFVAALGAGGYAIRRDLSSLYRIAFWLLLGLIVFGIVLIFVNMPGGSLIYAVLGLGVFGLYTLIDFNRLRRAGQQEVIPLAAGIFLDIFNIFLFFLRIFGSGR